MTRSRLPLLAALALLAGSLPALAADAKPPASVADLAWIAGDWQGTMGGDDLREEWTAPAGGTMAGSFRWISGGKLRLYEFLVFEDSPQGPVLTFRHFNPGLIGWEEKDAPLRCPLAGGGPKEAAFACVGTPIKLTYRKTGDASMTVLLERHEDGKPRTDEFLYTRAK
jgi:hypothetical protein